MIEEIGESLIMRAQSRTFDSTVRWANHNIVIEGSEFTGSYSTRYYPWINEILETNALSVSFKKGAQIGMSATLLPFISVGEHAVIGAGSVVTRDVPAYTVVCGNPARVLRDVHEVKCIKEYIDRPYA